MASTSTVRRRSGRPTTEPPPHRGRHNTTRTADRWTGAALIGLAVGLSSLAVLGPLVTGVIRWRISPLVHDQLLGLDAVSLVVVAPLAGTAGVRALRRDPLGRLLGFGPAAYVAYMVPQYVVGPDYLGASGNNERAFPLLLALFVVGVVTAVATWSGMDLERLGTSPSRERVVARVLLPVAAIAVFSRYAASLPDIMSAAPASADYRAGPAFVWTIALLDLGLALPAIVATIIGMRRGSGWARRALYAVVSWLALVGVAVGGMAVAMFVRGEPTMSVAGMGSMALLGLGLVGIAAAIFAPLVRERLT
jgi:hypothetical protein